MGLRLVTPPSVEPVSVEEVKKDLRIDHDDDDDQLERYISSAREFLEKRVQFKIAIQTLEFVIDAFPANEVRLPVGPVQSITSVKYDDAAGDEQTIDPGDYYLDSVSPEPWLFPSAGWPSTFDGVNSVRIQYVAGSVPDEVPTPVKAALRLKVQELYDGEDKGRAVHDLLTNYYTMVA